MGFIIACIVHIMDACLLYLLSLFRSRALHAQLRQRGVLLPPQTPQGQGRSFVPLGLRHKDQTVERSHISYKYVDTKIHVIIK